MKLKVQCGRHEEKNVLISKPFTLYYILWGYVVYCSTFTSYTYRTLMQSAILVWSIMPLGHHNLITWLTYPWIWVQISIKQIRLFLFKTTPLFHIFATSKMLICSHWWKSLAKTFSSTKLFNWCGLTVKRRSLLCVKD